MLRRKFAQNMTAEQRAEVELHVLSVLLIRQRANRRLNGILKSAFEESRDRLPLSCHRKASRMI
jgi:hypothetical protein